MHYHILLTISMCLASFMDPTETCMIDLPILEKTIDIINNEIEKIMTFAMCTWICKFICNDMNYKKVYRVARKIAKPQRYCIGSTTLLVTHNRGIHVRLFSKTQYMKRICIARLEVYYSNLCEQFLNDYISSKPYPEFYPKVTECKIKIDLKSATACITCRLKLLFNKRPRLSYPCGGDFRSV